MKLPNFFSRRRKSASLSKSVRWSFVMSACFHAALLLTATVFVIGHMFYNRESTFVGQPPPQKPYEPRKLEFKVKVSKQQRSSSRPSMAPRMVSARPSAISLPEIKMDPKIVKTSFQPKFKSFSGTGLGAGLGTGYGLGGFGPGVSTFDFFGIKGKGERIVILVDVSVSMIEEEKGGPKGYQRVKERIGKVIDALTEGSMFNVIVFADAASIWEKEMQVATEDNKTRGKQFLKSFNTEGNFGLTSGNITPPNVGGPPTAGGTTRLDLALAEAFAQGADTILIISDGLPRVQKPISAEQMRSHQALVSQWSQQHAGEMQAYQAAEATATYSEERVWVPPTPARPPRAPVKEGDPGDPGAPAQPGHWDVHRTGGSGVPRPQPPPPPQPSWWTLSDFVELLKILHEKLYVAKGKKLPVIHCIGYGIDKPGGEFLDQLAAQYKGRYRRVARIDN